MMRDRVGGDGTRTHRRKTSFAPPDRVVENDVVAHGQRFNAQAIFI